VAFGLRGGPGGIGTSACHAFRNGPVPGPVVPNGCAAAELVEWSAGGGDGFFAESDPLHAALTVNEPTSPATSVSGSLNPDLQREGTPKPRTTPTSADRFHHDPFDPPARIMVDCGW
jgi:hypothetical protein